MEARPASGLNELVEGLQRIALVAGVVENVVKDQPRIRQGHSDCGTPLANCAAGTLGSSMQHDGSNGCAILVLAVLLMSVHVCGVGCCHHLLYYGSQRTTVLETLASVRICYEYHHSHHYPHLGLLSRLSILESCTQAALSQA